MKVTFCKAELRLTHSQDSVTLKDEEQGMRILNKGMTNCGQGMSSVEMGVTITINTSSGPS